jgi:hypothetical protein
VWGHEYVITSLLEIAVSENKTKWPPPAGGVQLVAAARLLSMAPGKSGDDKDNPLHFSGEIKD